MLLIPYVVFLPGDNPMQAELCSHAGLACNYFCRTCHVGGSKASKVTGSGFQKIFVVSRAHSVDQAQKLIGLQPGDFRTPENTANHVRDLYGLAVTPGGAEKVKKRLSATGVRDSLANPILATIASLGKKLRLLPDEELTEEAAVAALEAELAKHQPINPLLGVPGAHLLLHLRR